MSQVNTKARRPQVKTHGGSPAYPHLTPYQQLRRTVLACLLWEDEFYEDGKTIADRIESQIVDASKHLSIPAYQVGALAIEARLDQNLRHVPLLMCAALAKAGGLTADTIATVIQRADEMGEFMAIYNRNGKQKLAAAIKKGLAKAFQKFDAYQLAKYNRDGKAFSLRDILFLVHAKPKDEAQAALWKQLVDGTLPSPDTWEVELSAGKDKRETFERLLRENKLGYLALLRNLRNMVDANVDHGLIRDAILARKGAQRVLPFRYTAAARACPRLEPVIDQALSEAISELPLLEGRTVVLVDVSPSMDAKVSAKSDISRMDAGATLASILHAENLRVFSFSNKVVEVPPRRGMAGVDAIIKSQVHNGTQLFDAIDFINRNVPYDRLIVFTDEQDTGGTVSTCPDPKGRGYMVNVASNQNGVGYGAWTHIDGFSENIIRYIVESEKVLEA